MPLEEYKRKRHFSRTPEPEGKVAKGRKSQPLTFVVQKHAATRLHYDLRLELDGVLKSWAVPKGPALDPQEKRLAVEVEDHPLSYGSFEGTIPEGEYGAGEVIVWDRGIWTPEGNPHQGLAKGKLEFQLDGKKLQGSWRLIRLPRRGSESKNNWLLIKRTDDAARPLSEYDITEALPRSVISKRSLGEKPAKRKAKLQAAAATTRRFSTAGQARSKATRKAAKKRAPRKRAASRSRARSDVAPAKLAGAKRASMPEQVEVQLATLRSEAPHGAAWLHEMKLDGYRMLAYIEGGEARLITRNHQDWTHRYPSVAQAAAELPVDSAILDGEVVALLPSGVSSFQGLQNIGRNGAGTKLCYYVFDVLYLDGYDVRGAPLRERKALLRELLPAEELGVLQYSDHVEDDGPTFLEQCCQLGLEGVISKRADKPYIAGRSETWIKSKCLGREELVIGGFTLSTAAHRGIGALLVGYFEGGKLEYAGRVGTGFTAETLESLRKRLEKMRQGEPPFRAVPAKERAKNVRWVEPQLVAEIEFTGWTEAGVLRHPSFQGLREDKPARSVTRPPSLTLSHNDSLPDKSSAKAGRSMKKKTGKTTELGVATLPENVRLTTPDRVLFPETGLTKLGLATFYAQIADWILPHLVDRPLSLVRCPEGQKPGKCFYQKHASAGTPEALRRVEIEEKDGVEEYLAVDDLAGLLGLVQMNVLEIHPWGSRTDRLDQPDRLILDLDPSEDVPWSRVIGAAREVRELLEEHALVSFVKTTGGKGLHVVIPISPRRHHWEEAKTFTKHVAEQLATRDPSRFTTNMSKAARKGRIFIDYLRNDRGATAITAYSTRAKPGAPVAVPLDWDELSPSLRSDHFHVDNLLRRLQSLKSDPWQDIDKVKQTLPKLANTGRKPAQRQKTASRR